MKTQPDEPITMLTKREFFAAVAMQGFLACPNLPDSTNIEEQSVEYADALINKLNEEKK